MGYIFIIFFEVVCIFLFSTLSLGTPSSTGSLFFNEMYKREEDNMVIPVPEAKKRKKVTLLTMIYILKRFEISKRARCYTSIK